MNDINEVIDELTYAVDKLTNGVDDATGFLGAVISEVLLRSNMCPHCVVRNLVLTLEGEFRDSVVSGTTDESTKQQNAALLHLFCTDDVPPAGRLH